MDFNQYVLLYLTGGYIGEDAPKVKIREVCADAPVTAYIEGAFKSTADLGMLHRAKQFILVKVPKGAYRVHFVKAGKRVCFKP